VPLILRRVYSVSDIDDLRIDVVRIVLGLVVGNVILQRFQFLRIAFIGRKFECRFRGGRDSHKRNLLKKSSVIAGGLQSIKPELRGNIFGGNVTAALSGASPFEQIVRKKTYVRSNVLGINLLHGRNCCRWKVGRGGSGSGFAGSMG